MEWMESTGSTIDEAKNIALDRLGIDAADAEFEVLADAKKSLFGRVKEEARVRARVRPAPPRSKNDSNRRRNRKSNKEAGGKRTPANKDSQQPSSDESAPRSKKNNRSGGSKKQGNSAKSDAARSGAGKNTSNNPGNDSSPKRSPKKQEKPAVNDTPTVPLTEQATMAEGFLTGLAERFGATVTAEHTRLDDENIEVALQGEGLGRMIGQRAATLQAIDELVRTVLQRQAGPARDGRIRVDIGGVRARRAAALSEFVTKLASEVSSSGTARSLEPMGGADRKIVHDVVNGIEGVNTTSEGEEPHRRVVIVPGE